MDNKLNRLIKVLDQLHELKDCRGSSAMPIHYFNWDDLVLYSIRKQPRFH